jgi:hypothetical protein
MGMKNLIVPALAFFCFGCGNTAGPKVQAQESASSSNADSTKATASKPKLDTARYDALMKYLANGDTTGRWPVKHAYPLPGAILPFNRIVA